MPPTEEDIAWFKSTFHPIPKPRLPDDCVEYSLYVFSHAWLSEDAIRSRLREVQKAAAQLQKEYLKDYIWQRQAFGLELAKEDGLSILRGRTEYGDSVEDEWIVVWLLRTLTSKFQDLFVKVIDNDGEFLLIEAAGTLPAWLEPDVAENRVWIHDSRLVIIKPDFHEKSKQKTTPEKIDLQTARQLLVSNSKRLMRSEAIEEEAFYRLRNYPRQIMENIHHTTVTIPRTTAFLLHQKPSYISPAVEAFYLRDPISLKPLQSASATDLTFKPTDLVTISIAIPRAGYAQLKSQDFPTPKSWSRALPPKTDPRSYSRAEMGLKISCGLEMLVNDSQHQDKPAAREIKMLLDDLGTGDETLPTDADISGWPQREDDEKWLDISFEDLDTELGKRSGSKPTEPGAFGDKAAQENLQRIVAQFEKFLNDDSAGVDGAGLFDEASDDDEELDSDDDISDDEGEDKDLSFSDEHLANMMREMMGMPTDSAPQTAIPSLFNRSTARSSDNRVEELDSNDEGEGDPTAEDIEALSRQLAAELNASGALDLGSAPGRLVGPGQKHAKAPAQSQGKGKARQKEIHESDDEDQEMPELMSETEEEDGDGYESRVPPDTDVNLARNLLESFRSQAGLAGPGGNMMGLMGVGMPRDEGDGEVEDDGGGHSRTGYKYKMEEVD